MRPVIDSKLRKLADVPLFAGTNRRDLATLGAAAEWLTIPKHTELAREGDSPDLVYVIVRGMVQVRRGGTVLAYLQDGDVVGELALLDGQRRTATVQTVVETEVVAVDRRHLGPLLDKLPHLAQRLEDIADTRRAA